MREYVLTIGEKEYKAEIKEITAETATISVNGKNYTVGLKQLGGPQPSAPRPRPRSAGSSAPAPKAAPSASPRGVAGSVTSPLPGLILELLVKEGDEVKAGQDLLVMEAMKMENKIQSPHDGVVGKIFVEKGSNVAEGDKLVQVNRPAMTTI